MSHRDAVMGGSVCKRKGVKHDSSERSGSQVRCLGRHGVFGALVITNEKTVYYGEIPVTKVWGDGIPGAYEVYMVLYMGDAPVMQNEQARILALNAKNNWTGTFRVALEYKDQPISELVQKYGYSVREVMEVRHVAEEGWQPAVQEGYPEQILYYHMTAEEGGTIATGNTVYMVTYQISESGDSFTVTNHKAYVLPETGGMGTHMYTISGLVLLAAAALIYGYSRRRKHGRGADA